mmetsp:Transcript_15935/g.30078  ORF Transcript_15935/g.30078 Transcript_15935/m.30078 type:complete len:253 (-) Transcript_15935:29-787(-)
MFWIDTMGPSLQTSIPIFRNHIRRAVSTSCWIVFLVFLLFFIIRFSSISAIRFSSIHGSLYTFRFGPAFLRTARLFATYLLAALLLALGLWVGFGINIGSRLRRDRRSWLGRNYGSWLGRNQGCRFRSLLESGLGSWLVRRESATLSFALSIGSFAFARRSLSFVRRAHALAFARRPLSFIRRAHAFPFVRRALALTRHSFAFTHHFHLVILVIVIVIIIVVVIIVRSFFVMITIRQVVFLGVHESSLYLLG